MQLAITTKPGEKYRSIKNPAAYEALRRQGMSKERAARISNAQARRRRHKAYTLDQLEAFVSSPAYDADTAQALAARVPELAAYKAEGTRSAPPAATTTAAPAQSGVGGKGQPGEKIAPGITRIRGNLCNVHGKWGPCDKALSGAAKPGKGRGRKPKAPKGPKAAKPKKVATTPEQKRQARDAERSANVDKALTAIGMGDEAAGTLLSLAAGEGGGGDDFGLIKQGLVERDTAGNLRLSASGREFMNASERGDLGAARAAISRGGDTVAKRGQADAKRASAAQARAERLAKRKPVKAGQRAVDALGRQLTETPNPKQGGGAKKPDPKPAKPVPARRLARQRQRALPKGGAPAGGGKVDKPKAPKPAAEPKLVTTPELAGTARRLSAGEELSAADVQALIRNGLARQLKDGTLLLSETGLRATRQKAAGLQVFKDTTGADRWLFVSSTAYRDRDKEIVSTKALSGAVAVADASGYRGPLRFWHVPGIDIGDCDYQATAHDGRFLIESGTFRSPALAAAVKAHAGEYQVSIGFTHPASEPDREGVFHNIAIFERSLVPRGRAANPLTQVMVTKGDRMLTTEKQAALTKLLDGDADLLQGLLAQVATTDKAAQDGGVAFKEGESPLAVLDEYIAQAVEARLKAAQAPVEVEAEPIADALAAAESDGADEVVEPDGDENMLNDAELDAIADRVVAKLTPLLDIEKKIGGHLNDLKAAFGQTVATKDAAQAELAEQVTALKAQVDDLAGSAPRIVAGGFRASTNPTTVTTDARLKEAVPQVDPLASSFGGFLADLGLAGPQV